MAFMCFMDDEFGCSAFFQSLTHTAREVHFVFFDAMNRIVDRTQHRKSGVLQGGHDCIGESHAMQQFERRYDTSASGPNHTPQ